MCCGCWKLVDLPARRKLIGCKWVFHIKQDSKSHIVKYKVLVALGNSKQPGIDFDIDRTYAPVMHSKSFHLLAALAVIRDLEWNVVDAVGTYLNTKLTLEIYMRQPQGFDDSSGQVCKLKLALYDLRQSG